MTAMSDRPHAFTISTPAGEECDSCGVTVDEDLLEALTISCPAGGCTDPANHGEACVFVRVDEKGTLACSYCERPGDPLGRYTGDDAADLDWFYDLADDDIQDDDGSEPLHEGW